jgi:hypothetical protein
MPIDRINWLAVLVGAVIYYLFGWLWYTVLGNQWLAFLGKTKDQMAMTPGPLIVSAVVALVVSFGTAVALSHDDDRTPAHGAQFGLFFGVFFIASMMLQGYMYEGRPIGLWLINAGYAVVGLVILGLLHGAWKKPKAAAQAPPTTP